MTLMPIGALEIALLGGREFVIDDQDVGLKRFRQLLQLLDFAVSEQRGRIHHGTHLKHFGGNLRAGAGGQFGKLAKGFGRGARKRRPGGVQNPRESPSRETARVKSSV